MSQLFKGLVLNAFLFLSAFLSVTASAATLTSKTQITCSVPGAPYQRILIQSLTTNPHGYINENYASAKVVCGRNLPVIECTGYYFGQIGAMATAEINVDTKTGSLITYYGEKVNLTCKQEEYTRPVF